MIFLFSWDFREVKEWPPQLECLALFFPGDTFCFLSLLSYFCIITQLESQLWDCLFLAGGRSMDHRSTYQTGGIQHDSIAMDYFEEVDPILASSPFCSLI
jgi:hypothetical protein